jgi:hypothetical protein
VEEPLAPGEVHKTLPFRQDRSFTQGRPATQCLSQTEV